MRSRVRRGLGAFLALTLTAPTVLAQGPDPLAKLDSSTRALVLALEDSARAEGLPANAVLSKAQEGVAKHASMAAIARAVRTVFLSYREARQTLGTKADRDELAAGAAALQAGIPTSALTDLRASGHGKSITVPLVVLADLVTRGVPRDMASHTLLQLWTAGASDADLLDLPKAVGQDILSGAAPGDALLNRARTIPLRLPPGKVPE